MTLSPRLDDTRVAAVPGAHTQPEPHTAEEIDQMIRLALARGAGGLAQMIRRLIWSTNWAAASTIGFASSAALTMHHLAGIHYLDGLTGATANGGTWRIDGAELTQIDLERDV